MISVIFLKMGKHGDFRISSFQVVDAGRILQFNKKIKNILKSLYAGFGGRCHKITDHVSTVITWSLFNFRAPNVVK